MYKTLIIVSRFISKASAIPMMESKVRALMTKSLRYCKTIYPVPSPRGTFGSLAFKQTSNPPKFEL